MLKENHDLMERFARLQALMGRYQMCGHGPIANPHRGQGRVLSILKMQPSISQKELGYLLDMRNQSLGELLNKLERSGLITRTPSEEDRRTAIIKLTPDGTQAAQTVAAAREDRSDKSIFSALQEEEKIQLAAYLDRIIAELEKRAEERGAFLREQGPEAGDWGRGCGHHGRHAHPGCGQGQGKGPGPIRRSRSAGHPPAIDPQEQP